MFGSVKKLSRTVKRVGCSPLKVLFMIYCHEVTFTSDSKIRDGAILSVCFERGGKLSSSPDRMYVSGTTERVFFVNEPLNLVATLYKDNKTGVLQEKKGKVLLRELTKNKFGGVSYVGLDVASLCLNEYVGSEDSMATNEIELKMEKVNGSIRVTITSQIIESTGAEEMDDTMSVLSSNSDVSELGATFEDRNASDSSFRKASSFNSGIGAPIKRSSYEGLQIQDSIKEEPEDYGHDEDNSTKDVDPSFSSATENVSSRAPFPLSVTTPKAESTFDSNLAKKSTEVQSNQMKSPQSPSNLMNERLTIDRLRDIKDNGRSDEEITILTRLESLRIEVTEKDILIDSLRKQMEEMVKAHNDQLLSVRKDLHVTKEALKREQAGRQAVAAANNKADASLGQALSRAREETETIAAEYAQVAAELDAMTEALQKARHDVMNMEDKLDEYAESAKAAATAATHSRIKLAEREIEIEGLIDELIATKMNCANFASDFEEERRKNIQERRKLQKYAERVAVLEVQIAMSAARSHQDLPPAQDDYVPQMTS